MPGFQEMIERLRGLILSFATKQINIIICHLDFDSLIAAFAIRYYVEYVLGVNKKVKIFYNGDLTNLFLKSICEHFPFFSHNIEGILHFDGNGGHIFIDYVGDSEIMFPKLDESVILGNIDRGIVSEHNDELIKFSSRLASASSIVFRLLVTSGCLKSRKKELKDLVFLLILAIHHDIKSSKQQPSSYNLNSLGRAIEYLGMLNFHDMLDKLPDQIKWKINSDDRK
jgi:hypothetical protein